MKDLSQQISSFKDAIQQVHPESAKIPLVKDYQRRMINLIDTYQGRSLNRSLEHAHFTVSAFICNQTGEFLALFHKKLNRWLQPGGHLESTDLSPILGARREAEEESGLTDLIPLSIWPVDLDIHLIPARSKEAAHEHFDIRYAFITHDQKAARLSDESSGLTWLSGNMLHNWANSDPSIGRAISVARSLLQNHQD